MKKLAQNKESREAAFDAICDMEDRTVSMDALSRAVTKMMLDLGGHHEPNQDDIAAILVLMQNLDHEVKAIEKLRGAAFDALHSAGNLKPELAHA